MIDEFVQRMFAGIKSRPHGTHPSKGPSPLGKKMLQWEKFTEAFDADAGKEDGQYIQLTLPFIQEKLFDPTAPALEIVPGDKTQEELLCDLGTQEAADYCRYLQIPVTDSWTQTQMTAAIAQTFHERPEYLLYVLYEEEYRELIRWTELPCGIVREGPSHTDTWSKAIALGLADVSVRKNRKRLHARLCFASDLPDLLKGLNANRIKQTYRKLRRFSNKLKTLILVYGVIDFDTLSEMFSQIYHERIETETLNRYIYWHVHMNGMVETARDPDRKCYVFSPDLDLGFVGAEMKLYADDMDYVMFPAPQLKKMAENISETSDWFDILFGILHRQLNLPEEEAGEILTDIYPEILNGGDLTDILDMVYSYLPQDPDLISICLLWECVASLMLDLPLPMLKGRSRNQYARETGVSPWQTGMQQDTAPYRNSKDFPMSQFPWEIQESMFLAAHCADSENRKILLLFQKQEKIRSEEFLCLLAQTHIRGSEPADPEPLLRKLRNSSPRGREAADHLERIAKNELPILDVAEDFYPEATPGISPWQDPEFDLPTPVQPYRRETPKIGRNAPCPCGSGKKYKNCCGRKA